MTDTNSAAVIVGATGGIGSALVRRLARQGWRLLLAARDADRLQALAREVGAQALPLDATDSTAVNQAFAKASQLFGTA